MVDLCFKSFGNGAPGGKFAHSVVMAALGSLKAALQYIVAADTLPVLTCNRNHHLGPSRLDAVAASTVWHPWDE